MQEEFLGTAFREIGEWIYEQAGVEIPEQLQEFELFQNPRGTVSCQGKLSYRGPIAPRAGALPRVKLDLTSDERLVLPPTERVVFHDYSDAPVERITVRCYAYEEAFGEKTRALAERTRPRDLYDVVNLYRNTEARPQPDVLLDVVRQKCEHRGIPVPTLAQLEIHRGDLEGSWEPMLGHQLQALPPVESYWNALPEFLSWLETGAAPAVPATYRMAEGETVLRERTLRLPVARNVQSYLEVIRFAAANRLCVDLRYQGSVRRIEPYSLRRTRDGNIVLHAVRTTTGGHRGYRVDRIEGVQATAEGFEPRYAVVESAGPADHPADRDAHGVVDRAPPSGMNRSTGPRYIYECGYCGRHFSRKRRTSRLNPHKNTFGDPCPRRTCVTVANTSASSTSASAGTSTLRLVH